MDIGDYSIEFDKTGFPLIKHKEWNFYISLVPVTKYQFEKFMIENGPNDPLFTNAWYTEYLKISKRIPVNQDSDEPFEHFLLGMDLNVIRMFFNYMGKRVTYPNYEQWTKLYERMNEIEGIKKKVQDYIKDSLVSELAKNLILKDLFPMTSKGLLEIINTLEDMQRVEVIGKPWNRLLPNLWNACTRRTINYENNKGIVGFRICENIV